MSQPQSRTPTASLSTELCAEIQQAASRADFLRWALLALAEDDAQLPATRIATFARAILEIEREVYGDEG